jgi:tRNA-2-methylthio-N6-dimethylallyladenosine synthase
MDVTERARFDAAFTFQYSPRPGTVAASMDGQVPKEVVQERFDRLVTLQERISLERNAESVGQRVEVLVEGQGRKGRASGRTRSNKLVHFDASPPPGSFAEVTITGAHPHHLDGELEASGQPARSPAAVAGLGAG